MSKGMIFSCIYCNGQSIMGFLYTKRAGQIQFCHLFASDRSPVGQKAINALCVCVVDEGRVINTHNRHLSRARQSVCCVCRAEGFQRRVYYSCSGCITHTHETRPQSRASASTHVKYWFCL